MSKNNDNDEYLPTKSLKNKKIIRKSTKKNQKEKTSGVIAILKKELFQSERVFFVEGDLIVNLDYINNVNAEIQFDEVSQFRPFTHSVFDKMTNSYKFFRDSRTPKTQMNKLYHILDSLGNQYAHQVCVELKKYFEIMEKSLGHSKSQNSKEKNDYSIQKSLDAADKILKEQTKSKYFAYMVRSSQGSYLHNEVVGMSQNLLTIQGFKNDEFQHIALTQGIPMFFSLSMFSSSSEKLLSEIKVKQILYDPSKLEFMDVQTAFKTADNHSLGVRLKGQRFILQEKPNSLPDDLILIEGEYDFDQVIRYLLQRNNKSSCTEIDNYKIKAEEFIRKYYKNGGDLDGDGKSDNIRCKFRPINQYELEMMKFFFHQQQSEQDEHTTTESNLEVNHKEGSSCLDSISFDEQLDPKVDYPISFKNSKDMSIMNEKDILQISQLLQQTDLSQQQLNRSNNHNLYPSNIDGGGFVSNNEYNNMNEMQLESDAPENSLKRNSQSIQLENYLLPSYDNQSIFKNNEFNGYQSDFHCSEIRFNDIFSEQADYQMPTQYIPEDIFSSSKQTPIYNTVQNICINNNVVMDEFLHINNITSSNI